MNAELTRPTCAVPQTRCDRHDGNPRIGPTLWTWLFLAWLLAAPLGAVAAEKNDEEARRVKISVSGLGWLDDWEQARALRSFVQPDKDTAAPEGAVEDAAFVLMSALVEEGYRAARVSGRAVYEKGDIEVFRFDEKLDAVFPRRPGLRTLQFTVEPGVRSYIAEVEVAGLTVLPEEAARAFFQPAQGWWSRDRSNVFSESVMRRAREALLDALRLRGFAEATVEAAATPLAKPAGAMRVAIVVNEGPRWLVRSVRVDEKADTEVDFSELQKFAGQPWSEGWRQDVSVATRRLYYRAGHPDAAVRVAHEPPQTANGETPVDAILAATPGPFVKVGAVKLEGNVRTREATIRRRLRLKPGDPLDPLAIDRARLRLGRLSAFSRIETQTSPVDAETRDVTFLFEEAEPWSASVLFGYGSYEELRGGIELRRTNLWGRAHQDRFFAVQSMKSTRGDYTYTVPDLFGEAIDGSARAFALRREEVAFDREEYGGELALRTRLFGRRGPEATAGYTYESLREENSQLATRDEDPGLVKAASINLGLSLDRRDQALNPRSGYRWQLTAELASKALGGEVDYQRFKWAVARHWELTSESWLHVGLSQAAVLTMGGDDAVPPPVNKLYYPGGDHSLRGYTEGEAAPRAPDGSFLGAKTYTLLNVEVERSLTKQWVGVVFFDWLVESDRLRDYPGNVKLSSVGLGLRYKTIVGPIRVEYGRNLNPRPQDPSGTWHLSVGYPF